MPEPEKPKPDVVQIGGVVVAIILIATFLVASWWVMTTANDPPLLADPAPTAPPVLVCPSPTASAATPSTRAGAGLSAGTPQASGTAGGVPTLVPGARPPDVGCNPGQVVYAPQYRGGFDPNARLMALLGIVVPLLTTIVGFYFGQRAGASTSEAEKQKLVTRIMSTDPSGQSPEVNDLKNQLRASGLV